MNKDTEMHTVRIQVIKVYDLDIEAVNADEALGKAYAMQSTKIENIGALVDVSTDFVELV